MMKRQFIFGHYGKLSCACLAVSWLSIFWSQPARAVLTYGIDISHYQSTINWASVASDSHNVKFAFMKATEDTNYTDPTFSTNDAGAIAAGILAAPYHFCRLDTNSSDPVADGTAEANYFLSKIKSKYQANLHLPPVADVEGFPASPTKTFVSNWVTGFSDTIYNALGVRPLIYTSKSKANTLYTSAVATANPLWVAWWKTSGMSNPPTTSDVSPWTAWKFWQWSDDTTTYPADGHINGFGSTIRVDRDVFNGTVTQLKALLLGKDPSAKPGDFNRDGVVNSTDYNVWLSNSGKTVPMYTGADGNGDARVTQADYNIWAVNGAPEPGSCILALAGVYIVALGSSRGRRSRFEVA